MTKPILHEANDIIYGEREQTYGDPGKNLRVIADYWNTYLINKGFDFLEGLDYDDVCNMMVLLKMARLGNTPLHRDSMVDACGYLALADRVQTFDQNRIKEQKDAEIQQAGIEDQSRVQQAPRRSSQARGAKPRKAARNR